MTITNNGNEKDEVSTVAAPQQERQPLTSSIHNKKSCLSRRRRENTRGELSSAGADRLHPNSVTFAERCKVRLFRRNMKEDNLNAWYSAQDINRFKQECVGTLKVLLSRSHQQLKPSSTKRGVSRQPLQETASSLDVSEKTMPHDTDETWAGLDCFLPWRTKVRTNRRLITWELVLECQEVERTELPSLWDPAWTAQKCSSVAEASASDARRAALVLVNQLVADSRHRATPRTDEKNRTCNKKVVARRAMSLPVWPTFDSLSCSRPLSTRPKSASSTPLVQWHELVLLAATRKKHDDSHHFRQYSRTWS